MNKLLRNRLMGGQGRARAIVSLGHLSSRTLLCAGLSAIIAACGGGGSKPETATTKLLAERSAVAAINYHLYVSSTGSDANPGTLSAPFRTIQAAANSALPGTTVHVGPGTYAENIVSITSGSANHRIVFISSKKWGAKIVAPPGSPTSALWQVNGTHTDIVDFEFSASGSDAVRIAIEFSAGYSSARGNYVHHIGQLPLVCGSTGGAGIKSSSDPVSAGHTDIVANVVHDIGQGGNCNMHGIYLATSGTIKNNLVHNIGWGGIHLWRDNRHIDVSNNTVFRSHFGIIYGSGDQLHSNLPADYINVSNNIIYDNGTGIRNAGLGPLGTNNTFTNNLVFNNATDWNTSTRHVGDIAADPQFVNYTGAGGGDYRLRGSSPAIDRGAPDPAPATDLDGAARPQGAGPDVGAYEYSGDRPTPPPPSQPPPAPTTSNHLYVATTGSDANPGSASAPFRTIQKAAQAVKSDTTVHVASGTYLENVKTNARGSASARIRYVSDVKWGARIIGSGKEAMWTNHGNYVDIVGFDISGSGRLGILNFGSNSTMSGNHVHDLALSGGCTGNGGAGINNASYSGSDNDIIGNVVHDIGVPGKCNGVHGIYSSNLRGHIYNNIVYRASSWGIHLWHAADNVMIANNTVFSNGAGSMGGGILLGNGDSPGGVVLNNTNVVNNIVYNNPAASIKEFCYAGESCIGPNNLVANNLVYANGSGISLRVGSPSGTINADPQFVNYRADGTGDYRLKSTSPAVNKGLAHSAPSTDIDNATRPSGGALDIGAYENY